MSRSWPHRPRPHRLLTTLPSPDAPAAGQAARIQSWPPGRGRREGGSAVPADQDTPHGRRVLDQGPDGRLQRRRVRLRHHAARPGHRGSPAGLAPAATASAPGPPTWPTSSVSGPIGGAWLAHTALTDRLARADSLFLRLNLLVLLVVVFLPFPTGLVADALHDSSGERVYVTLYGLTILAIRLLGSALDWYARHEHLYPPKKRARSCTAASGNSCPSSSGT